ncbi:MAG: hypothetical protein ACPGU9_04570 [Flavobacteriaceae bacterium]
MMLSNAQVQPKNSFTEAEIYTLALEIFQQEHIELFTNSSSRRKGLITRFLNEQYSVAYEPGYKGKNITQLSSLPLNNKHNINLLPDYTYNPESFNPLKYKFPLNSQSEELYRIGSTDYIITIHRLN